LFIFLINSTFIFAALSFYSCVGAGRAGRLFGKNGLKGWHERFANVPESEGKGICWRDFHITVIKFVYD
jgi:hypothetical protein